VLLVALFIIYKQLGFARSYDLGFDKTHLLQFYLSSASPDGRRAFKEQVDLCAFVENSSLSSGAPGNVNLMLGLNEKDDVGEDLNMMIQCILMDDNFMKTMGIELTDGREMNASDAGVSCYINEEGLKQAGWRSYEGKRLNNMSGFNIVGVVHNFSMLSVHEKQEPVALIYANRYDLYGSLSVRLKPGNLVDQMAGLEKIWKGTFPDTPIRFTFYDDIFDAFYRKEMQQAKGIVVFSIIALIITCMGLLGQVFQSCLTRRKEIGIRKINGATITDVISLFSITYIKWFVAAFVVAVPVSFYVMNKWLQAFAYKTTLSWWVFVLAGASTLALMLVVVGLQCLSTAMDNPVESIKAE
jgi:putative ABC transport system permease protein